MRMLSMMSVLLSSVVVGRCFLVMCLMMFV